MDIVAEAREYQTSLNNRGKGYWLVEEEQKLARLLGALADEIERLRKQNADMQTTIDCLNGDIENLGI